MMGLVLVINFQNTILKYRLSYLKTHSFALFLGKMLQNFEIFSQKLIQTKNQAKFLQMLLKKFQNKSTIYFIFYSFMMNTPTNSLDLSNFNTQELQSDRLIICTHPNAEYNATHDAMLTQILARISAKKEGVQTPDELWIVEHQNVYTLGQAGKEEHILYKTDTPIIKTDRGGQVTWHGTGQLVIYWLWDLHALDMGVRDLVSHAEQAIEDVVNEYLPDELIARARRDAPGVYIFNQSNDMLGKIASLGFKIKQGYSYHGIAINLMNDLSAFHAINPCGYAGMNMVKLANFGKFKTADTSEFMRNFIKNIQKRHKGAIALRVI